jgi:hypothetical protein
MARKLECADCGALSGPLARGWLALRWDDPEKGEPPELAFYCPSCTLVEFGIDLTRRHPHG